MSDRDALNDLLARRSPSYNSCRARLIVETRPSQDGLVQGTLLFQNQKVAASKNDRDYGPIVLMDRTFTLDGGREILQDIFKDEFSPKLRHHTDVMINRHPDEWRPGPTNLPVAFSGHPRFSGWPERIFLLRSEKGGQLPAPPIIRRGLPSILSIESLMRGWLGLDPTSLPLSGQILRVVLPDYRARLLKISLKRGTLRVQFEKGTTDSSDLSLTVEHPVGDNVQQIPLKLSESVGEAEVSEFPNDLYVFLYDSRSEDVVDWAHVDPFASRQPAGIETELPPSVLEEALNKREGGQIEFKKGFARASPDELLTTAVAFSNAEGGRIFVGVTDGLQVVGVSEIEKMGQRIREMCHELVEPPVSVATAPTHWEDKDVLVVAVPSGADKPYRYRRTGQYLVRKGDTDRPMTRSDMDAAYRGRGGSSRLESRGFPL